MEGGKPISRRLVGALLLVRLEPRRYCPSCVKDIPRALFCRRGPRDCLLQAGGEGQRPGTTRKFFLFFFFLKGKKDRMKRSNCCSKDKSHFIPLPTFQIPSNSFGKRMVLLSAHFCFDIFFSFFNFFLNPCKLLPYISICLLTLYLHCI